MENSIIKILNKYGYSYNNDGTVTPPRHIDDLDNFSLNYELDEVVLEDEDFRFSYEIREDDGVLKLFKNEL